VLYFFVLIKKKKKEKIKFLKIKEKTYSLFFEDK